MRMQFVIKFVVIEYKCSCRPAAEFRPDCLLSFLPCINESHGYSGTLLNGWFPVDMEQIISTFLSNLVYISLILLIMSFITNLV